MFHVKHCRASIMCAARQKRDRREDLPPALRQDAALFHVKRLFIRMREQQRAERLQRQTELTAVAEELLTRERVDGERTVPRQRERQNAASCVDNGKAVIAARAAVREARFGGGR